MPDPILLEVVARATQAPTWSLNFTKLLDSSLLRTIGQNGTDTPWKGWGGNISEQAVVKLSEDGKQLTVKGARFDTIEATALLRGRMFDAPKPALKAQLMAAIEAVPSRKPYSAFGTSSECPPMPEDLGSSQWRQDLEDFRQSKRAFDPYKRWAARSTLSKVHHIQDTLSEAFQLWWRAAGIPTEVTERVEYGMQFDIGKYAMYATAVIGDVDICTTASGFVALGPARSLEEGDVIALLAGAKFPVALSPNGSGGHHFRGLLYAHVIMYDELRACGLSESLKEESFVLA
ncbi:unnamed protein product [Cercospora beticola]|nr:unnamed protein product [Cercospora beticola]